MRQYPCLEVHTGKITSNVKSIVDHCRAQHVQVCGVIKGCNGLTEVARAMRDNGCVQIGSSRLEQIQKLRQAGIPGPYMLIRVPGFSELQDTVSLCEYSLQSDLSVVDALDKECERQNRFHSVVMMTDLGDLREGFWDRNEFVSACLHVERLLKHVNLAGIGVNLGCVGSVKPTKEKMLDLLDIRDEIESAIGHPLEIVSGGGTSTYPLVQSKTLPKGINHLRIGENILLASDLQLLWGLKDMDYLHMDTFTLHAEIIEIREKPSYPQGELMLDAFGHVAVYQDKGIRTRALLALGRADVGDATELIPLDSGITIEGCSSDHTVIDVTDSTHNYKIGDIVDFHLRYQHMLYATGCDYMRLVYSAE